VGDRPTNKCACGCGELTWGEYRQGHREQPVRPFELNLSPDVSRETLPEGPPPGPVDHRRWRLAAERPGTNPASAWIKTRCCMCKYEMWTRDPLSTWEHGGVCEEDEYILREELATYGRKQFQQQARTFHDPFRPKP